LPEYVLPLDTEEPGYGFDGKRFTLEVYRLLCLFGGSKSIAGYVREFDIALASLGGGERKADDIFELLEHHHFQKEVFHSILSIAGMLRIIEERYHKTFPSEPMFACGQLWEPSGSESRELTLREACNKLIHASRINFSLDEVNLGCHEGVRLRAISFYEDLIYLYGSRGTTTWRAELDVVRFCRVALMISEDILR
jgi:hypothetical protein